MSYIKKYLFLIAQYLSIININTNTNIYVINMYHVLCY